MKLPHSKEKTPYEKELWHRKARMYVAWVLATIVCVFVSVTTFDARYSEMVDPQIKRAYVKINELIPDFAVSERSLDATYNLFLRSRQDAEQSGIKLSADYTPGDAEEGGLEGGFTLEWVTQLNVGNHGSVIVANKDTGEIVAHPDEGRVGKTLTVAPLTITRPVGLSVAVYKGFPEVDLKEFSTEAATKDLQLKHMLICPGEGTVVNILGHLDELQYGSIVSYEDSYIICGIDAWEYLAYMARAIYIVLIVSVLLWLVVHYISMVLDRHDQDGQSLRTRLVACTVIVTMVVSTVSWYVQVLGDLTSSLNAMQSYASSGVDNIENYKETQKRIDDWLDAQYLTQCRIACDYVNSVGVENVDREDLAALSEDLGVMHVYVYDEQGQVVVTNSPYDHFSLSDDPEASSYAFRSLLDGADHVIQPPLPDEISGNLTQFIGVSRRNAEDLADGFVQVAIDPSLREYLTGHLTVDSVLANMTVGEPDFALAFDNKTFTVVAATNPSFIGETIEDFGYTKEKLKENSSGFFEYNYETYCVGFAESDDYILVPFSHYPGDAAASKYSLHISVVVLVGLIAVSFIALYKYDERVVEAAPLEETDEEGEGTHKKSLRKRAMKLMGVNNVVKARKKRGFEERWDMADLNTENTPERKIFVLGCQLLLVFCLLHLVPLLYGTFFRDESGYQFTGLSYVISGNWEKGVNIFALTSCLILLFGLYVFMIIANRILFEVARVSSLRTETVCLLLRSSLSYLCVVAFIYYGLSQFGIPTQALLASVGIITLAVSVGAKDLVNDIIAGFFILLEGDLKVGDWIVVGSWKGSVQEIGLRTTKVTDAKKALICNNSSLRNVICCEDVVVLKVSLPVALDVDLEKVDAVLKEELPHLMDDVPSVVAAPVYEGVVDYNETQAIISIKLNVKSNTQGSNTKKLGDRVMKVFERHGIARIPGSENEIVTTITLPDDADVLKEETPSE